jgi:hypothetical protein
VWARLRAPAGPPPLALPHPSARTAAPQSARIFLSRIPPQPPTPPPSQQVRQQAADLIARIAPVLKACEEEQLLGHLGVVLYEYLGEEYPEVLGSILGGLKSIVSVIGMTRMTPPIKELLPRLTPILKNRHEKVRGRTS